MHRAAERLFVTQPAVSQSLKRLRHHFSEELFIRTPRGMQPTRFTEQLVERIQPILDELSSALNADRSLDPSTITGTIRMAMAPQLVSFLSGRLFRAVRKAAPGVNMQLNNWGEHSLRQLANSELDLAINVELPDSPKELMMQKLALDEFTLYGREGHPLSKHGDRLQLAHLDGCELAVAVIPDWNKSMPIAEKILLEAGYRVRVGFRSDLPGVVTEVVRSSDMVYPASSYIDELLLQGLRAFHVDAPGISLDYPLCAYYHQKNRRNPLTQWLCGLARDLLER